MKTVTLRPIDPQSDFPRLAELISTVVPEPVSAADLEDWQQRASPQRVQQRIAALDEQGCLIGFNDAGRDSWKVAGKFWLDVTVDPAWRKQGIGTLLYTNALEFAQREGATLLEAEVRDHLPASLRFAQKRDFQIDRHLFESTLHLAGFDETHFAGVIEGLEASGLRFTNLAELGETLEARRQLYELNRRSALHIPGRDQTYAPFEQFQQNVFAAPWYRADGQIVALANDTWIGMTAIGYFPATNSMYNMITGVDQPYRGRGIALALKLLAIRCARKYGAAYIRTNNDSENAPMLAVNRKLGYQPQPGKYLLLKKLEI
ncbi:MAG TPA: GNAT family N-acetyltransferase [Ktedonobacteraceae bacterium]|nr:GNAT family N-acetyltransferase [Ktedonobacteraceae bacterium]